jgi:hypothetical protein
MIPCFRVSPTEAEKVSRASKSASTFGARGREIVCRIAEARSSRFGRLRSFIRRPCPSLMANRREPSGVFLVPTVAGLGDVASGARRRMGHGGCV